jgi:MFS transporter, NNP family, nitrate/nitrite transporter
MFSSLSSRFASSTPPSSVGYPSSLGLLSDRQQRQKHQQQFNMNILVLPHDRTSESELTNNSEKHGTQVTQGTAHEDDDIEHQPPSLTSAIAPTRPSSASAVVASAGAGALHTSNPSTSTTPPRTSFVLGLHESNAPNHTSISSSKTFQRKSSFHYKKYTNYACKVDPRENDKATELKFWNISRPHMRAFYCAWWSLLISYVNWFAIAPLLPEVRRTLHLSRKQLWTSSIASIPLATVFRLSVGSLCDKYGARSVMMWVLMAAAIPTACTGLVQSALGLSMVRLFSGIGGSAFVMTQHWANAMFSKSIVGFASGIVGNTVEIGVTQLFMGSVIFPLFKKQFGSSEQAWRWSTSVPAVITFITGIMVYHSSDDTPKGNYKELKKQEFMPPISVRQSFQRGVLNGNAWLLFIQYACCTGLEFTMANAASLYFTDQFGQSTETAAAIASIYGWVAPIGVLIGGSLSDYLNRRWGLQGRLMAQLGGGFVMGVLVLVFAQLQTMTSSVVLYACISIAQFAAGSFTFAIVPYVDPPRQGTIAGIVASGGGFGAIVFGLGFRQLERYEDAFRLIGWASIAASALTFGIRISGSRGGGLLVSNNNTTTTVARVLAAGHDPSTMNHTLSGTTVLPAEATSTSGVDRDHHTATSSIPATPIQSPKKNVNQRSAPDLSHLEWYEEADHHLQHHHHHHHGSSIPLDVAPHTSDPEKDASLSWTEFKVSQVHVSESCSSNSSIGAGDNTTDDRGDVGYECSTDPTEEYC